VFFFLNKVKTKTYKIKMEVLTMFILFVVILVVTLSILWFITKYRKANVSNYNITHLIEGQEDATQYVIIDKTKIPLSTQGNEYSLSLWVFIKDYNYRYGSRKVLLYRGDKENTESNPYIYFEPKNNDLTVRVQLQSGTGKYFKKNDKKTRKSSQNWNDDENNETDMKNNKEEFDSFNNYLKSNVSGNSVDGSLIENFDVTPSVTRPATIGDVTSRLDRIELQMSKLTMKDIGSSTTPTPSSDNLNDDNNQPIMYDECTIENVPIQRWVHLVVSIYNNNIEIYMDGKLHKTCNLSGFAKPNLFNMHVTPNGGFNGFISGLDYSDAALPSEKVYDIYRRGPKLDKTIMDKIGDFTSSIKNVVTN
jgi:hypothetical protein